jgi:hypothetical protein
LIKLNLQLFAFAGKKALIKVSGAAVPFVGEPTTSAGPNLTYQITSAAKQIVDLNTAASVHKLSTSAAALAGTTTTNITLTAHGLVVGDCIVNTTRANAARLVTAVVDADNFTVAAITGQTTGDNIAQYPTEPTTAYTLNKVIGTVIYPAATARTILVSGSYLTTTTAAECKDYKVTIDSSNIDVTKFQDDWLVKIQGLLSASGSLSRWLTIDTTFYDALIAGLPIVIELYSQDTNNPDRMFAILNKNEMSAAVAGALEEAVSFESTNKMLAAYS